MGTGKFNAGGNPEMDLHVNIPKPIRSSTDVPLGSYGDFFMRNFNQKTIHGEGMDRF